MLLSYFFCVCSYIFLCGILSRTNIDIKGFLFYLLYNYIVLYTYSMCINYLSIVYKYNKYYSFINNYNYEIYRNVYYTV